MKKNSIVRPLSLNRETLRFLTGGSQSTTPTAYANGCREPTDECVPTGKPPVV